MSSPLSNLKKPHKHPLMGPLGEDTAQPRQRPVPFRNPAYSDDESKLLEEITGGMVSHRMKTRDPFNGGLPKLPDVSPRLSQGFGVAQKGVASDLERSVPDLDLAEDDRYSTSIPSDHDLMSTMMSRITQLEAKVAYQSKELSDKEKRIKVLTEQNTILQKIQGVDSRSHTAELENKCFVLQEQMHQMETFLADYGMVWVGENSGENSEDEGSEGELWRPGSSVSQGPKFRVDYNRLIENIKDLNALAGDGVAKISHTKDGARLKMPDPIQLTLYANGMLMFNGPFRPFSDPTTQVCVQDMLDGYFPSELQGRYPDGVPFLLTDKREVHFEDKRAEVFTGAGQTLGGETMPSRLVPTKLQDKQTSNIFKTQPVDDEDEKRETTSELPGPQLTVEQFLQKLPKSVIKAGKVIDIRNSLGDKMQGGPKTQGDVTLVETDTVLAIRKRLEGDESRPFTPRDITTLRVKSEDGNHTYILKMKFSDTIGDLRKYIQTQRSDGSPPFDIVSAYPNKTHGDGRITLQDAGLTPNAVAHLKAKKT